LNIGTRDNVLNLGKLDKDINVKGRLYTEQNIYNSAEIQTASLQSTNSALTNVFSNNLLYPSNTTSNYMSIGNNGGLFIPNTIEIGGLLDSVIFNGTVSMRNNTASYFNVSQFISQFR
jgi:hypothetical protein